MIYVLTGVSLLFIAIGFMVTENNAQYLLSGYNTMSNEERKQVDIKAYIQYFRRFHLILGASLLVPGVLLTYMVSQNAAGIFLTVYPVAAYMYFLWHSTRYFRGLSTTRNKVGVYILGGTLVFVAGLLVLGLREADLIISETAIEIKGIYGEKLGPTDIRTAELVNSLPEIVLKTNGFGLGTVRKGYFKTKGGEKVKLIINGEATPYLLLTRTNGMKIYYSSKNRSSEVLYNEIKKTLPGVAYKHQ